MSLRIRRGTEAQRTGATFDLGEIVYATDTNKLYVGDGVNLGGKNILATSAGTGLIWNTTTQRLDFNGSGTGIINVQADPGPTLGGNLNLNNRNITGTGITLNGSTGVITATQFNGAVAATTITASGDITTSGNVNITGNISLNGSSGIGYNPSVGGEVLYIRGQTEGTTTTLRVVGFNFAKGTSATPTNTVAGDFLGGFAIKGYRSTDPDLYTGAVAFIGNWDASADFTGSAPASGLTILTGRNGGQNQYNFNHTGVLSVPILKVSNVAGTLPTPQAGMIVLDGTTFKGYTGSAWVTLG